MGYGSFEAYFALDATEFLKGISGWSFFSVVSSIIGVIECTNIRLHDLGTFYYSISTAKFCDCDYHTLISLINTLITW